jgi:hypothetical protein
MPSQNFSDAEVAAKRCTKCKEDLPETREFFYRNRAMPGGWWRICKACYSETPCIVARNLQRKTAKEANAKRREALREA